MTDSSFGWNIINKPEACPKKIHIVVQDGLVQEVYAEGVEVEVVIHDLDTDDYEQLNLTEKDVAQLPDFAKKVY